MRKQSSRSAVLLHSCAVTAQLICAFVFAAQIVQFLFYLHPKFQASSHFLWLYSLVCVRPVQKLHCWFSHEAAHMLKILMVHTSSSSDRIFSTRINMFGDVTTFWYRAVVKRPFTVYIAPRSLVIVRIPAVVVPF